MGLQVSFFVEFLAATIASEAVDGMLVVDMFDELAEVVETIVASDAFEINQPIRSDHSGIHILIIL